MTAAPLDVYPLDAYDVLGVALDADAEDIKKAYRKLSLQYHPDKLSEAQASDPRCAERFQEIKQAYDVLQDVERRKIYDVFSLDLGEERPEMEVWNLGLMNLLSPLGGFVLKTIVARIALWLLSWDFLSKLVLLAGFLVVATHFGAGYLNVSLPWFLGWLNKDNPNAMVVCLNLGIVCVVTILNWIWPLLMEAVVIFFLIADAISLGAVLVSWKYVGGVAAISFVLAWFLLGRWFWVVCMEIGLIVVVLISLMVACGLMRLYIDSIQMQHGDKIKTTRKRLRDQRAKDKEEIERLKKRVAAFEATGRK